MVESSIFIVTEALIWWLRFRHENLGVAMSDNYEPEKVWEWKQDGEGKFANINRPISGAISERELPEGKHPFQLHSLATPNGVKVTVMFEELLALGHKGAEYDAYPVNILEGDQFTSGFVALNPNSKIPALLDRNDGQPIRLFESASILVYLADKFGEFLSKDPAKRAETMNWLFWQMGSAPYLGGGFGHFYAYAPMKIKYAIDRFTMETKRQLDVLDKRLAENKFLTGDEYTIADMAVCPWYGALVRGELYDAAEFIQAETYQNVRRWANEIYERPAYKRGRVVNRSWGNENEQLPERHDSSDFDKLGL
jgi:GST-like protein